ncbi:aminotransferase class I/II-fold pyridoxal phosphate-dependent enzyme [bacterium]|nr:aminotransferase class I/II-fold pyridoxal phosphate-dependent enzyme [bacterium]
MENPARRIQDYLVFGEYGEVNPSISDGATFTFLNANKMEDLFHEEVEGCFLYSRHLNPMDNFLGNLLAQMEDTEASQVTSSGMGAITTTLMQICSGGDEIVSSRTIYGGTYAFMKNFLPRFNVQTNFVDITNLEQVEAKITPKTKLIYCETISNPLLEIADLPKLREIADKHNVLLVVDNTFSPMIFSPYKLGAHIVIYSLTKYANGMNDTVAGAVCASHDFISSLRNPNNGASMLLGPTLDPIRASMIYKNLHTLHIRMKQHSKNAMIIAEKLENLGLKVYYPGLKSHRQYDLMTSLMNKEYGYGGMLTFDAKDHDTADNLMIAMQTDKVGYFAVSLGFYKTLFSSPGSSTSSEIPEQEQIEMGLTPGLVRMSIGLDDDIDETFERMKQSMKSAKLI